MPGKHAHTFSPVKTLAHGARPRMLSVDCLRGAAVAGMILANNPGDYQYVYQQLTHAEWHGWTLTDFIFPMFLFLVGVSVGLATDRERAGSTPGFWPKALRRVTILFLLGLFENGFPDFDLESLRIPGVLQRIAVVYLLSLWLHLRLSSRRMAWLIAVVVMVGALSFLPALALGPIVEQLLLR